MPFYSFDWDNIISLSPYVLLTYNCFGFLIDKLSIKYKEISKISNNNSFTNYLIDHIYENMLFFLNKNTKEFNETNIMEHPQLIKKYINKYNIRINDKNNTYVKYRYYSTVLYVFLAYIKGLTIQIDNYKIVKDFLEKRI